MRALLVVPLAVCLLAAPAAAQSIPPVSGPAAGDPGSDVDRPSTTGSGREVARTGKTKPPGAPVGESLGTTPQLERRQRELEHRSICSGC